jgi:thioredoxin
MSANTPAVTGENFETEVLQSPLPVLVDFSAEWCGPCKALAPTIGQIANEYAGRMKVVTMDVDESMEISVKYNVQHVPTLMLFKNGEPVERLVGGQSKPKIVSVLQPHLG